MTPEITIALIAAVPTSLAAIATLVYVVKFRKEAKGSLDQIHVLVNSRLTEALGEIVELKKALGKSEK